MGFGSIWHWVILLAIVILFFGGKRLPQLGRSIGETVRSFKKGLKEEEIDVTDTVKRDEIKD